MIFKSVLKMPSMGVDHTETEKNHMIVYLSVYDSK